MSPGNDAPSATVHAVSNGVFSHTENNKQIVGRRGKNEDAVSSSSFHHRFRLPIVVAVIFGSVFTLYASCCCRRESPVAPNVENFMPKAKNKPVTTTTLDASLLFQAAVTATSSSSRPTSASSSLQRDLTEEKPNPKEMYDLYLVEKETFYEKLKVDYGPEAFNSIFMNADGTPKARGVFSSISANNTDYNRMKRKISIKILKYLNNGGQQAPQSNRQLLGEDDEDTSSLIPFIWATGGHSAAAGHGNFFNQSYTAYMERGVKSAFARAGINFIGRNYAMGGHASGPSLAFCVKEVYGNDFDVLSWDFGMTDGRSSTNGELYFYRAGLSANNPVAIGFGGGKPRCQQMSSRGMAALYYAKSKGSIDSIPDTAGKSEEEIKVMPPYIRSFRCGHGIEKGEPHCGTEKFMTNVCPKRRFRTSWHPGWKSHALRGNDVALFLLEILADSLHDIMAAPDRELMLKEFESQDEAEHQQFLKSDIPPSHTSWNVPESEKEEILRTMYKSPNVCHYAELPAEIRYKGILTESEPVSMFSLPESFPMPADSFALTKDGSNRQVCSVPLNQDFPDFLSIKSTDEWKELTVPNDREIKEYGISQPLKGMVALCYSLCPWHRCKKDNVVEGVKDKSIEMEINGHAVTTELPLGKNCFLLSNKDSYFWKPNTNGRFTFRMRVMEANKYAKFSTFVVW